MERLPRWSNRRRVLVRTVDVPTPWRKNIGVFSIRLHMARGGYRRDTIFQIPHLSGTALAHVRTMSIGAIAMASNDDERTLPFEDAHLAVDRAHVREAQDGVYSESCQKGISSRLPIWEDPKLRRNPNRGRIARQRR